MARDDRSLALKTTLGLGGPARRFERVTSLAELTEALRTEDRILVLGGGSNLVVGDAGWDGLVLQIGIGGVDIAPDGDHALVTVGAGVVWDELVAQLIGARLVGVECLSGIPGLVGATPIQNVGAYGQEVADTIVQVRALHRETGDLVAFTPEACRFAYRTSAFKGSDRWIITEVQLRLARGDTSAPLRYPELVRAIGAEHAPLATVRDTVIALRRAKGMVVDPADPESRSAGSFFTNPIIDPVRLAAVEARLARAETMPRWPAENGMTKLSAGWLIEHAGFARGYTVGRVGISRKHALALVNRGGATTHELLALAREIQDGVRAQFGIELVPEPVIV